MESAPIFRDRSDAGRALAGRLAGLAGPPPPIVLGLPRGGVPVAHEIAQALGAPLDAFVVRKLGIPGSEETAMGAVASGGVLGLDQQLIRALRIPDQAVEAVIAREWKELARREHLYRDGLPPPAVDGRTAILVDDGLATGASMQAAIEALHRLHAARIVVAIPVAAHRARARIAAMVDEVVSVAEPEPFQAVGLWYADFSEVADDDVRGLLAHGRQVTAPAEEG
jgi:predicted phosphoribosyltransferase